MDHAKGHVLDVAHFDETNTVGEDIDPRIDQSLVLLVLVRRDVHCEAKDPLRVQNCHLLQKRIQHEMSNDAI